MKRLFIASLLGLLCLSGLAGCDSGSDSPPNERGVPPIARIAFYLLSPNFTGGIDVFNVNYPSGALTAVPGSPFATAQNIQSLEVHPNQRFVYGGVDQAPFLEGFYLDPATGTLSLLPGFPVGTVADGNAKLSNDGQYLYVAGTNDMDAFRVEGANGSVSRLPGFPRVVPGMINAKTQEFTPDGRFLYVTDSGSDQVFIFAQNNETGALTLLGQQTTGGAGPSGVGIEPNGNFVYFSHFDGTLTGFAINNDGSLTTLPGGATAFAPGPAASFEFAFREGVLFIGSDDNLNAFRVGANGSLTAVAGYPRSGGGSSVLSYPVPLQDFLYTADLTNSKLNGFTVNAGDSVTPLPNSPFPVSGAPYEIVSATPGF